MLLLLLDWRYHGGNEEFIWRKETLTGKIISWSENFSNVVKYPALLKLIAYLQCNKVHSIGDIQPGPKFQSIQESTWESKFQSVQDTQPGPKFQSIQESLREPKFQFIQDTQPKPKFQSIWETQQKPKLQSVRDTQPGHKFQSIIPTRTQVQMRLMPLQSIHISLWPICNNWITLSSGNLSNVEKFPGKHTLCWLCNSLIIADPLKWGLCSLSSGNFSNDKQFPGKHTLCWLCNSLIIADLLKWTLCVGGCLANWISLSSENFSNVEKFPGKHT